MEATPSVLFFMLNELKKTILKVRQIDVWDVSVKELNYDTFERIYSRYSSIREI